MDNYVVISMFDSFLIIMTLYSQLNNIAWLGIWLKDTINPLDCMFWYFPGLERTGCVGRLKPSCREDKTFPV